MIALLVWTLAVFVALSPFMALALCCVAVLQWHGRCHGKVIIATGREAP